MAKKVGGLNKPPRLLAQQPLDITLSPRRSRRLPLYLAYVTHLHHTLIHYYRPEPSSRALPSASGLATAIPVSTHLCDHHSLATMRLHQMLSAHSKMRSTWIDRNLPLTLNCVSECPGTCFSEAGEQRLTPRTLHIFSGETASF